MLVKLRTKNKKLKAVKRKTHSDFIKDNVQIYNLTKKLGAVYTPIHTAEYMVNLMDNFDNKSRILEPCGGDGVFVSVLLKKKNIKPDQIEVWDINPDSKKYIEKFNVKFKLKDTLLDTDFDDLELFKQTFTHIIGNPPYLNKQSEYIKNNKKKLKKIYWEIGVNDTYALFIYLCSKLLAPSGQLCFITSDTYLTLGIHKKLRKYLLQNFKIKNITLCPKNLFKDKNVSVNTCIIKLVNEPPTHSDKIIIKDLRNNEIGNFYGKDKSIRQLDLLKYPDYVIDVNFNSQLLSKIVNLPKMIEFLEGGLGMHTTKNNDFLAAIEYDGTTYTNGRVKNVIPLDKVDNIKWRFYHKKGGNIKYYFPVEYAIKWDKESIKYYKMPKDMELYTNRDGFVVSGVCSELSARLYKKGALWESNKAMCFFPKDPLKYPVEFFIGILNSRVYNDILKIFNHTNSIQIRDIRKLPMFDFKKEDINEITQIAKNIIKNKRINLDYDFREEQEKIDKILKKYI